MFQRKSDILFSLSKTLNLYKIYETYAWEHEKIQICILFQDLTFQMKILQNNQEIDYVSIQFEKREREIYQYFCLFFGMKLFENVWCHYDEKHQKFYNSIHRKYLQLIISDQSILNSFLVIQEMLNNHQNQEIYDSLEKKYLKVRKKNRKIAQTIEENLDTKIFLTKKWIREGFYE